jgi:hypothetical protein
MPKRPAPTRPPKQATTSAAASSARNNLLDETIAIWQARTSRPLTREDAREIIENMTGFFNVVREWDRAERAAAAASEASIDPQSRSGHRDELLWEETP